LRVADTIIKKSLTCNPLTADQAICARPLRCLEHPHTVHAITVFSVQDAGACPHFGAWWRFEETTLHPPVSRIIHSRDTAGADRGRVSPTHLHVLLPGRSVIA